MKISSDIIGYPNRNRPPVVQHLYRLRNGVIKCARGIEIYCFLYNQIYITVFTRPASRVCVNVDICRSYPNTSHLRSILILSSQLLIFHPNGVFVSGNPAIRLRSQFLCYTCHSFSPSRPRYNQLYVYTLSSLANGS